MRFTKVTLGAVALVAAFAAWWTVATHGLVSPFLLPPPWQVLQAAARLNDGYLGSSLLSHLMASLSVVLGGYLAAAAVGIPLGIFMGWSKTADALFGPLVGLLRPIPPPAWIPLAILWFGIGLGGKVFVVFVAAFTPCLLNAYTGMRDVPPHLLDAARMLGASRRDLLFRVAIPSALPIIASGLRIGLGSAWGAVVAAELVVATAGFGFVIMNGYRNFEASIMAVGIIAVAVVGFALSSLFRLAERRVIRWSEYE